MPHDFLRTLTVDVRCNRLSHFDRFVEKASGEYETLDNRYGEGYHDDEGVLRVRVRVTVPDGQLRDLPLDHNPSPPQLW